MKPSFTVAAAVALTLSSFMLARAAEEPAGTPAQQQEKEFVHDSASGNKMEVELGQFVAGHTQNAQAKQFAETLVQDHQKSQEQLKQAAQQAGVAFNDDLTPVHQAMLQEIEKKSGKDLDRDFAFSAIADHHKDILEFTYASKTLSNPALKQYAQQTLPVLQKHLNMADQLAQIVANVSDVSASAR